MGLQAHADRYTYLPHIGLLTAAVWGVYRAVGASQALRKGSLVAMTAAAAVLGVTASAQTRVWHDTSSLFTHALEVTRGNFLAHNILASELLTAGKLDEAEGHLRAALELQPGSYMAKGNCVDPRQRADYKGAIELFRAVLEADPSDFRAHNALGNAYIKLGDYGKAIEEYQAALALAPNHPALLKNLENVRQAAGKR